jgi:hypothetical protein
MKEKSNENKIFKSARFLKTDENGNLYWESANEKELMDLNDFTHWHPLRKPLEEA